MSDEDAAHKPVEASKEDSSVDTDEHLKAEQEERKGMIFTHATLC